MDDSHEKVLLARTLEKYGAEMQLEICIEECAELIQVLQKYKRMLRGTPNAHVEDEDIISEVIDVDLTLEQMKLIFPRKPRQEDLWTKLRQTKLIRLARRL